MDDDSSRCFTDHDDQRVYLIPHRWWKESQKSTFSDSDENKGMLYTASQASVCAVPMKIINNIFNPDIMFNLKREEHSRQNVDSEDVGVSGRDYALVTGEKWLQALKRHADSKVSVKDPRNFSAAEDETADVYPLQLRLSPSKESKSLGVKISKKDNSPEIFRRACKIFSIDAERLHLWDYSGKIMMFFTNDKINVFKEYQRQFDPEIVLEMQIYGLSDLVKSKEVKKDETALQNTSFIASNNDNNNNPSSLVNGISSGMNGNFPLVNSFTACGCLGSADIGSLGLAGLQNLGNTCFMNSAVQCLLHTPKLVEYFLGDYSREINHDNPLGMEGGLALAFGDLVGKLWAPGATLVAPRLFKSKLAHFAPQFGGFNQHDSQELLAFLLDGLHEDLNRVKCKLYVEAKDEDSKSDGEVADEYWNNHLARNDSIIVDLCQGQYKSTLVCPDCQKVSITFDPFMYLSLPLPSTTVRSMTVTVVSTDGTSLPSSVNVTVPKSGKCEDLMKALRISCSLPDAESFLLAEIYSSRIIRYVEDMSDSLSLIRDEDRLVAYRFLKGSDRTKLIVFMHEKMDEQYAHGKSDVGWKAFGFPLITRFENMDCGLDMYNEYMRLLSPFRVEDESQDMMNSGESVLTEETSGLMSGSEDASSFSSSSSSSYSTSSLITLDLQMHVTDDKGRGKNSKITRDAEPIRFPSPSSNRYVLVSWPSPRQLTDSFEAVLPEICRSLRRPQEYISLYKCLEAFLKEEPLGPDDMWYCPTCKKHCQASKKLDLWRLPEILVIHLKRFSYSRFMKNKLEAFVDFPVEDFHLLDYMNNGKGDEFCYRYELYAISNHYGSIGGGHYTAFVHHRDGQWYDFDDARVFPIGKGMLKTSAAYVLFYRRLSGPPIEGDS